MKLDDLAERAKLNPLKRATCRLRDGTRIQAIAYRAINRVGPIVRFKLNGRRIARHNLEKLLDDHDYEF